MSGQENGSRRCKPWRLQEMDQPYWVVALLEEASDLAGLCHGVGFPASCNVGVMPIQMRALRQPATCLSQKISSFAWPCVTLCRFLPRSNISGSGWYKNWMVSFQGEVGFRSQTAIDQLKDYVYNNNHNCVIVELLNCCMPSIIIVSCSVLPGIVSSDTYHKSQGHAWV